MPFEHSPTARLVVETTASRICSLRRAATAAGLNSPTAANADDDEAESGEDDDVVAEEATADRPPDRLHSIQS